MQYSGAGEGGRLGDCSVSGWDTVDGVPGGTVCPGEGREQGKAGAFSGEAGLVERAPSPPCLLLPPKEE